MTKYLYFFSILGMLFFSSCSALMEDFDKTNTSFSSKPYDLNNIRKDINRADYDVNNLKVMGKLDEYKGKIISVAGSAGYHPNVGPFEEVFIVHGTNMGYRVDIVTHLDNPIVYLKRIDDFNETLDKGKTVRLFGVITGMKAYLGDDGVRREMIEMDALAIFNPDDFNYKRPLWTSKRYNK